jgi:nucleotide-binding universal stress UspA family protein
LIRTILVPLDGSPFGELGLHAAAVVARQTGAALLLLRALAARPTETEESSERHQAEQYLAAQQAHLAAEGLGVSVVVVADEPVAAILHAVVQHGVDLIALCTHGMTGVRHLVFGSVAESVLQRSRTPLLIVRGPHPRERTSLQRLLVPIDDPAQAEPVLAFLQEARLAAGAQVTLLHTMAPDLVAEPAMLSSTRIAEISRQAAQESAPQTAQAEAALLALGQRYLPAERARVVLRTGLADEEILSEARAEEVDLIVMGTHGRHGIDRILHGSVAMSVLKQAEMPILLIHENGH